MPKDSAYVPILVGAKKNFKTGINFQRDDDGSNISNKNSNYSELTAMFWAWKNMDSLDAIGLVHYRRYFMLHGKSLSNVLSKEECEKLFKDHDAILPKKRRYYIETNYSHYVHAHHREPLDMTRKIIANQYPEYLESFDTIMDQRSAHMFNMFIMKKDKFDGYAQWLFSILCTLEKRVDISDYSVQEARVYGYIAELLLNVWVVQQGIVYKEVRWYQLGPKKRLQKLYEFLIRKFISDQDNKKTHFD